MSAKTKYLRLIYEQSEYFRALPTFGIIPTYHVPLPYQLHNIISNFVLSNILYGEQDLEIFKYPIPTSDKLVPHPKLIDIIDKGKAAIAITKYITIRISTGEKVLIRSPYLTRDPGGFGVTKSLPATEHARCCTIPASSPDMTVNEATS